MSDSSYSFLDKVLHRLALQFSSIAELSFELDQQLVKGKLNEIRCQRHIFVSGLARAGTTILMRRFYDTGQYRSLTYQDMPFILAPNLWGKLRGISKRNIERVERAHGDQLIVSADSPESLDEVFWRVFSGSEYIRKTYLKPHEPSDDIIHKYIHYVEAILVENSLRCGRYLSKNNNNILRLSAIQKAFPNAMILIPFRNPIQHAYSLLRQHRRYSELQTESGFTLSYMTWLSHHEFGLDHRPFLPVGNVPPQYSTDTLNYWLQLWCDIYLWLEVSKPKTALLICYEDLCTNKNNWIRLCELADISINHDIQEQFKLSNRAIDIEVNQVISERALEIYERLVMFSRSQLS